MEANKENRIAAAMIVLKCLTYLHAGNGEVNYNIIDNEVERDPVTNYPMINSSGVKGAFKSFLKDAPQAGEWFGTEGNENQQAGKLKILSASMLAVPMRMVHGDEPYRLIYTETMKKQFQEMCEVFGLKCPLEEKGSVKEDLCAEGYPLNVKSILSVNGSEYELYRMKEEDFSFCGLPVIARNALDENGKSTNLWYEEVVPHKSIFYIPVIAEGKDGGLLKEFKQAVNGKVIQFGGHASIGYGLCKVFVED